MMYTVLFHSQRLVDVAIGLVNSESSQLAWQASVIFLWNSNYRRTVINPADQSVFWGN